VDIYAPKTVRSSMGSLFHIPVLTGLEESEFVENARRAGYELLVTCLDGADELYEADLHGRLAFVMGNEANGVSASLLKAADKRVYIPMNGRAESLNVAMAAGIVLFEALRQERRRSR
jgi:TrmH family RNA methyltransferase